MPMFNTRTLTGVSLLALVFALPADAQSIGERLKRKAKEAAAQKAAEKAAEKVEKTMRCSMDDQQCIDKAKAEGKTVETTDASGKVVSSTAGGEVAAAPQLKPGEGAWVNYDFKPGDRPIFVDDFTKDEVGDFPKRLEFKNGNMEVAEWQGGRYLRISSYPGKFAIVLPEQLPERFTVEFDATPGYGGNWMIFRFAENAAHEVRFRRFADKGNAGVWGGSFQAEGATPGPLGTGLFRGRIMADGRYVKVYINELRLANIPNADLGRSNTILVEIPGHETEAALITNISVMAGGKKLYDALAEKGRVATQGIYFDSGSDIIRPESTPTLKEIGGMLKEHPDLKLTIEGHTDNVGNAQANHDLSHKRAAAVKAFIVSSYGIDASRLEATGFGDKKPVGANTTPEGRQQNRRVELVKS
ncbi:MAG: OmpA family protein [Gemmatimonadaceae bacterium]